MEYYCENMKIYLECEKFIYINNKLLSQKYNPILSK